MHSQLLINHTAAAAAAAKTLELFFRQNRQALDDIQVPQWPLGSISSLERERERCARHLSSNLLTSPFPPR